MGTELPPPRAVFGHPVAGENAVGQREESERFQKRRWRLKKKKKKYLFFGLYSWPGCGAPKGEAGGGGCAGRARRLPPLFPRRGARSRMAGAVPCLPPLPGRSRLRGCPEDEDGDGGRRGAGGDHPRSALNWGRGGAGRRQQPSGEAPWGRRGVLQPATFPVCSILLGFKGFGRAGDALVAVQGGG